MQQKISASDKDFTIVLRYMVILSCYMMLRLFREENNAPYLTQHYPQPGTKEFEETLDVFVESFLDEIYGNESSLTRAQFLIAVVQKTSWVFESEDIRSKWDNLCDPLKNAPNGSSY